MTRDDLDKDLNRPWGAFGGAHAAHWRRVAKKGGAEELWRIGDELRRHAIAVAGDIRSADDYETHVRLSRLFRDADPKRRQ